MLREVPVVRPPPKKDPVKEARAFLEELDRRRAIRVRRVERTLDDAKGLLAAIEARKKRVEEEERRKRVEEEARKKRVVEEEETRRAEARRRMEEEARRKRVEEEARMKRVEEEARRRPVVEKVVKVPVVEEVVEVVKPTYTQWIWNKFGERIVVTGATLAAGSIATAALAPVVGVTAAPLVAAVVARRAVGMGFDMSRAFGILPQRIQGPIIRPEEAPVSAGQVRAAEGESRGLLAGVWKNGSWVMGNVAALASTSTLATLGTALMTGEGTKTVLDIATGDWVGAGWRVGKVGVKQLLANTIVRTKVYQMVVEKLGSTTIGGAAGRKIHEIFTSEGFSESIREGRPIPEGARRRLNGVFAELGAETPGWVNATWADLFASLTRDAVDTTAAYAANNAMSQMNYAIGEAYQRAPELGVERTLQSMGSVASEAATRSLEALQTAGGTAMDALNTGVTKAMEVVYGPPEKVDTELQQFNQKVADKNLEDLFQPVSLPEDRPAAIVNENVALQPVSPVPPLPVEGMSHIMDKPEALRRELENLAARRIAAATTEIAVATTAQQMAENRTLFSLWDQKEALERQLREQQRVLQELQQDQIMDSLQATTLHTIQEHICDLETKLKVARDLEEAVKEMGGLKIKALEGVDISALGLPISQAFGKSLFKAAGKGAEYFHKPLSELQDNFEVVRMSTGKTWVRDLATQRLVSQEVFEDALVKTGQTLQEIPWRAPEQIPDLGRGVGTAGALAAFGEGNLLPGVAKVLGPEGVRKAIIGATELSGSTGLQRIAASFNPFSLKLQLLRGATKVAANTGEWLAEGEQNMFIEGIGIASGWVNSFLDTINIAALQDKYLGIPKVELQKIAIKVFMEKYLLPTGKTDSEIIASVLNDVAWGTIPAEDHSMVRQQIEGATQWFLSWFVR